ncbi:peptidyl-prolyl cis-trans isomerase [Pseudomonas benzenivorans]|uniref:peptidylprolyl isomerase n=1 Tax=Pseudomonas benzenivorans TaxID=556533 RepID=A0ABZ0PWI3_9PSED|nr:peptidyl-prolyl cis-trans isomerase [Pseudomonas benzenivorans]WPC05111.1 peptidyl-prolyl cis-trans isomerase [Pseudomonas benzenivorans]
MRVDLRRALVLLGLTGICLSALAGQDLRIDGERLPGKSIELLERALTRVKFNTDPAQLRAGLVENRLLARAVEAELQPRYRADLEALVEVETANLIEQVHGRRFDHDVRPFLRQPQPLGAERLRQVLAPPQQGVVLDSLRLSPAQQDEARGVQLIAWQFPGQAERRLDLLALYQGDNVQGRVELQQGNLAYLAEQVRQHVLRDYLWYQLAEQGFDAAEREGLRLLVRDKLVRHQYLHQIGLHSDFHHETDGLKQLAREVGDADAEAYYRRHLAQYRNVARVQAAHIRLADQASADRVYAELQAGLDFDEAVRRYSLAEDKSRTPPGDLGLIRPQDAQLDFLHKTALLQKAGTVSQPMLIDGAFEIVRVRQREDRQLPLSDPSVRYEVNQAVAKEQLASQLQARLQALLAKAKVEGL